MTWLLHACTVLLAVGASDSAMAATDIQSREDFCQPVLTVQSLDCRVETILRCDGTNGIFWRSEVYTRGGLRGLGIYDQEYVQLVRQSLASGTTFVFDTDSSWSSTPEEILADGHGQEITHGVIELYGLRKPVSENHRITVIDPPLTIDGMTLHRFEFSGALQMPLPVPPESQDYTNYYDPSTGALFFGEDLSGSDGVASVVVAPVRLDYPGDPGFDSRVPEICGALSQNTQLSPQAGPA